jgi:hypothetical protein
MCETPDKLSYLTLRDAAGAALEQLTTHGPRRPYMDSACDRYHLTSQNVTVEQVNLLA